MQESAHLAEKRPGLAAALTLLAGAGAYAGVSLAMRGTARPLEVGLFAVPFAAVYVAFARYSDAVGNCLCSE